VSTSIDAQIVNYTEKCKHGCLICQDMDNEKKCFKDVDWMIEGIIDLNIIR
jgi:hypothetical protein